MPFMQHYRNLDDLQLEHAWGTIGVFDGVHRGHQVILKQLVSNARAANVKSIVITFFPHPAVVLGKNNLPSYLTSPDQRAELLSQMGIDIVLTLTFDKDLASKSALDFMQMLQNHINLQRLFVGVDFALGRGREGDISRLSEIGDQLGYTLKVVEPLLEGGERISSSQVRRYILDGNMPFAARLLGRNFSVDGLVVPGDGRGKSLGIPTANLDYWLERVMPASGVYATWAWVDGIRLPSVSNLGTRPTFENAPPQPRLEAHLLDYNQDLYGKTVQLEFVERLRPESRFSSVDALVEQVHLDIKSAKEVLKHAT
jgi:riboflavin kinase / FMN adenylyltransferase